MAKAKTMQELCQSGSLDAFLDELKYHTPVDFARTHPAVKTLFKWAVQGANTPVALWLFEQHTKAVSDFLLSKTLLKHAKTSETRTTLYRSMVRFKLRKIPLTSHSSLYENVLRAFDISTIIQHDRLDCIDVLLSECKDHLRSLFSILRKNFILTNYGRGYLQLMRGYGAHGVLPAEYLMEKTYGYFEVQRCALACLGVLPYPYPIRIVDWDDPQHLGVLLRYTAHNKDFRRDSRPSLLRWFQTFCYGMEPAGCVFPRTIPDVEIRLACLEIMWRFRWQEIPLLRFVQAFECDQTYKREWRAAGHVDATTNDDEDDDDVASAIYAWMLFTLNAARRRLCTLLVPVARHFLTKPTTGTLYRRAALSFRAGQVEEFRKRRLSRLLARAWRKYHPREKRTEPEGQVKIGRKRREGEGGDDGVDLDDRDVPSAGKRLKVLV